MPEPSAPRPAPPSRYQAYLLRLWRDGPGAPWRGSLEVPAGAAPVRFGTVAALFAFLRDQLADPDPPPEPPRRPAGPARPGARPAGAPDPRRAARSPHRGDPRAHCARAAPTGRSPGPCAEGRRGVPGNGTLAVRSTPR